MQHLLRATKLGTVLVLLIGVSVGAWGYHEWQEQGDALCNRYSLLSPLIRCNPDASGVFMPEYEEFEKVLSDWIDSQRALGQISSGAVYFRDLVGGPWFGVNEDAQFIPASLFKVPVMIAVLRVSQDMPELLKQKIIMSGAYLGLTNVQHPEEETVHAGRPYTVDQLLEKMIVYSDNASADVLKNLLAALQQNGDVMKAVYQELGLSNAANEHVLTVKTYSSLFRVLYNGRYLHPDMSQKALDLLSRSAYRDGMVAGVPGNIVVAHKFGIRDVPEDAVKQFHDCGIVYYPKRPYLLCIMTRSGNVQNGIAFIQEASRRVYEQVDSRMHAESSQSASARN